MANPDNVVDLTQVLANFKQEYEREAKDLRIRGAVIQALLDIKDFRRIGQAYNIPILATHSQGAFYDVAGGTRPLANYPPISPQMQNFNVPVFEMTERMLMALGVMAQADNGQRAAFLSSEKLRMLNLNAAIQRNVEQSLLYGQQPIGVVQSQTGSNPYVLTLVPGSYAPGYLSGMENTVLSFRTAANGSWSGSNFAEAWLVTNVDSINGLLTISNASNATLGLPASTGVTTFTTAPYIFRWGVAAIAIGATGSNVWYEMPGLLSQIVNTSTLFSINYANYSLLLGGQIPTLGVPSVYKFLRGVAMALNKGLDGDVALLVSHNTFISLLSELMTKQFGPYSESELDNGAAAVTFRAQGGIKVNVVLHPFVKDGDAFLFPLDGVVRVAGTDITSNLGGLDLTVLSSTANAFEFRLFTDQAIVAVANGQCTYFTGITYQS